jgi:hypothetical protein
VTESGWTGAEVTGSVATAQLMDLAPLLAESMGLTVADG